MKFFAPKNEWNMASGAGFNQVGQATVSGVRVTEESALAFSAVFAATRVISETLASLPLNLLEQVDARTTRKATGNGLYSLLHDAPNPEQDIMSWLDMQTALQVNWGNAYNELQRDSIGSIVAIWPIHPSRIPVRNITRNAADPDQWHKIQTGQPGEIVYWVSNDDGTKTPIAASDMLHIPGVLSSNGITGKSIVLAGANSIGIGLATEKHAGAFFANGATMQMAIKSPKTVGKEAADRLRSTWQATFGGVNNHYKTLFLEEGMDVVPINMSPEHTQLILARQFSVTEIARWYRLPPHMLADLTRSSFSNIESEMLSFVIHSMVPWIVRWEKALFRQLLTKEQKKRFRFKFNMVSLLRGDSAARAAYYKALFEMGVFSPNDINELEDRNPVEGGDQRFVPGNNLVPLAVMQKQTDDALKIGDEGMAATGMDGTTTDVQATALNGAQIVALVDIASRLATEQLPPEGTRALIEAAFPMMDRALIDTMVEELDAFTPEPIETEQPALGAPAETSEPAPDPKENGQAENRIAAVLARIEQRDTQDVEQLAVRRKAVQDAEDALRDGLRKSIEATIAGMVGYESRAAKQAAKKPQTFLTWLDEFYAEFRGTLATAMEPYAQAAERIGFQFDADLLSLDYSIESRKALEALADLPCSGLEAAVADLTDSWSGRAAEMAAFIIPERSATCVN